MRRLFRSAALLAVSRSGFSGVLGERGQAVIMWLPVLALAGILLWGLLVDEYTLFTAQSAAQRALQVALQATVRPSNTGDFTLPNIDLAGAPTTFESMFASAIDAQENGASFVTPKSSLFGGQTITLAAFDVYSESQLPATNPLGAQVTQPSVFVALDVPVPLPFAFPGQSAIVHESLYRQESLEQLDAAAGAPQITDIAFTGGTNPQITIYGQNFGAWPQGQFACSNGGANGPDEPCPGLPVSTDSAFVQVLDDTAGWRAGTLGNTGGSSAITLEIVSWSPSEVVIGGFGGSYANYKPLSAGDSVVVGLWNPETGQGGQWSGIVPSTSSSSPQPAYAVSGGNPWNAPQSAQAIWATPDAGAGAPNGVPYVFGTHFSAPSTEALTVTLIADGTATVYLDGQPVYFDPGIWQNNQCCSALNIATFSLTVGAGSHTLAVFAENTGGQNPVASNVVNPAMLYLTATDPSGNSVVSTANTSEWSVYMPSSGLFDPYVYRGTGQTMDGPPTGPYYPSSGIPTGPSTLSLP